MKKVICLTICIMLFSLMISSHSAFAQTKGSIKREVSNSTPKAGDTITVSIKPSGVEGFYAVQEDIGKLTFTGKHTADSNPTGTTFSMITAKEFNYSLKVPDTAKAGDEFTIAGKFWSDPEDKKDIPKTVIKVAGTEPKPASIDLAITPKSLSADGKSTATATATVKDSAGKGISGLSVTIKVTKGKGTIGAVKDNKDGTYSATYTASNEAGTETITASTSQLTKSADITLIAPPEQRTLSIPEVTAPLGQDIEIPIDISDAKGVTGADIVVKYDEKVLKIKEVKTTDLSKNWNISTNYKKPGEIVLAMVGKTIESGKGSFANMIFSINAGVVSGIDTIIGISGADIYDSSGNNLNITKQDGKVKIGCLKGDVNGNGLVQSNDAILVLQFASGELVPTAQQFCAADMNNDGKIRSNDSILILNKSAGLTTPRKEIIITNEIIAISLDEYFGESGKSINVPIKVDDIRGLAGGDIDITYDSSILRVIDVSAADNMMLSSNATEDGLIRISFVSLNGLRSNILAKIEFDVISDKITALNIQKADLYRSDALPIESKLINGVFRSWAIPAKDNELLQNFPNPFNPETWIPYQLKVKSYVTILISSSNGNLVREIKLGDKMAGTYSTKDRAAYWDGKSEEGEYVSNGIYFYTIKAGDFVATRKMVIMK